MAFWYNPKKKEYFLDALSRYEIPGIAGCATSIFQENHSFIANTASGLMLFDSKSYREALTLVPFALLFAHKIEFSSKIPTTMVDS